jgi:hypothetical protein
MLRGGQVNSPVMSRGALSKLYYDSVLVGEIADPFEHQGTWFGTFISRLSPTGSETQRRLAEFIAFSERWHERLKAGGDPDAAEFDEFGPIVRSGGWQVVDERGERTAVDQAPVFVDGEVSWVCPESRPPSGVT